MLGKKKSQNSKKGVGQKKKVIKLSQFNGQTLVTTKQKTFATIQQTNQPQDHKISTRTTHFCSKKQYIDQMQANKLSPFSSPGKSISPRYRNSLSPFVVKQQAKKKNKKNSATERILECKKIPIKNKKIRNKEKSLKEKTVKSEFHNEFIKRMSGIEGFQQKKITQLSQESAQGSICKRSRPKELKISFQKKQLHRSKASKMDLFKQMHLKIKYKYRKMYPKLQSKQLKVLSAVVLIQRIWRQKKVKDMIGNFLSPRVSPHFYQETIAKNLKNYQSRSKTSQNFEEIIQNTMKTDQEVESFLEIDKSKQSFDLKKSVNQGDFHNNNSIISKVGFEGIDLKSLQLSDDLSNSSTKEKRIISYIKMYRQVTLIQKKQKIKKKRAKPNVFSIPESFSEKCLLDKLYRQSLDKINTVKISRESIQNEQNFIFPTKSLQKSKQQYLSPQKHEVVELQERFYTEAQDEQYARQNIIQKNSPIKPEQQTVGSIGNTAEYILKSIIEEFSEQFLGFTNKKCLKKKRKAPGIRINSQTISIYLRQFIAFVEEKHPGHIGTSFKKISSLSFLKIFRIFPDQQLFIFDSDVESEEEDEFSWPILPATAFFQYQPIYEDEIFVIVEQDKKYSNFLLGLIKIHNKCLVDCLSEFIEKNRVDSFLFPWDTMKTQTFLDSHRINEKCLTSIVQQIIKISQIKLGTLRSSHRYPDLDLEETNLLESLKEEYRRQGRQWNSYSELLEIRLQLTEAILEDLWNEAEKQISNILLS